MANTKATVRGLPVVEGRNTCSAVKPFKLKEILPQQKTVNIKIKTNNKNNKSKKKMLVFFRQK